MADEVVSHPTSAFGRSVDVFRQRPFMLFWIGIFVSNIGNWTENAAQSWAVTSQTVGNPHQAWLVEVLQFADFCPVLLLALLAGAVSDRVDRKVWLISLQAAACVLGTGLAVAAFTHHATPWVVIGFTFLEGIVWALNGPVFLSVIPTLVPRPMLDRAIALNSIQFNMARLAGPMIAALIISAFGIAGAFAFNASTFAPLLVVLLIAIPHIRTPKKPNRGSLRNEIREGLKFVWKTPGTRRLTIMGLIFMFLAAPLQGLLPVFAQHVLNGGPTLFGAMLSAIGLGSILGAFVLSILPAYYPRHHLIPLSMCIFASIGMLFSFSTSPLLSLLILVAGGMFWLLSLNPVNTANQLLATDENRGRVMSIMLLANQGGMPLGHLFAGFLTHYFSPQWVIRLMLGTLLAVMIVFLFLREPAIDNLPRRRAKMNFLESVWEALTARSHRPVSPAEVDMPEKEVGIT